MKAALEKRLQTQAHKVSKFLSSLEDSFKFYNFSDKKGLLLIWEKLYLWSFVPGHTVIFLYRLIY